MHDKLLKQANIENLTRLWVLMGASSYRIDGAGGLLVSDSWPYRCWFEPGVYDDKEPGIVEAINQLDNDYIFSLFQPGGKEKDKLEELLLSNRFNMAFEQTAMYLELQKYPLQEVSDLKLNTVNSVNDCEVWTDIATRAFGYQIDPTVVKAIFDKSGIQLFVTYLSTRPVGTALLFQTGNIVGLHQLGVLSEYRRRGIGHKMMSDIINLCSKLKVRYITLQASVSAKNMYRRLGFKEQFSIKNYQKQAQSITDRH